MSAQSREREAFEADLRERGIPTRLGSDGEYVATFIRGAWLGWRAARASDAALVRQMLEVMETVKTAATDMRGEDFNLTVEQWAKFHEARTAANARLQEDSNEPR